MKYTVVISRIEDDLVVDVLGYNTPDKRFYNDEAFEKILEIIKELENYEGEREEDYNE